MDKFIDIRLVLKSHEEMFEQGIVTLAKNLPLKIPYGDSVAFSVDHAAQLAGKLAKHINCSMRQAKKILLKVEVALRCYSVRPLDASLLVFLAFKAEDKDNTITTDYLPRAGFTPELAEQVLTVLREAQFEQGFKSPEWKRFVKKTKNSPEIRNLSWIAGDSKLVASELCPIYIPEHQEVLDAVAKFQEN